MKLEAILFDLDGTLRDTREPIYSAIELALADLGFAVPSRQEMGPYIHHHSFVHQQFAPQVSVEEFESVYARKIEPMLPSVQLYQGAEKVLRQFHGAGYKIAIVTAARSAPQDIPRHGIVGYVDVLVSAHDITKHKPDPEGTTLALERLDVEPERAVLVGDMATDVRAAHAAGITLTVGLTHGLGTRESLEAEGTSYVIDSLRDLPGVIAVIEQMA